MRGERWRIAAAFVTLAIVTGPIVSVTSNPLYFGLPWPTPWSGAVASAVAGILLLGFCAAKGWTLPRAKEWLILALLLAPRLAAGVGSISWVHETGWGVVFLIGLAAPMWLGLLSAAQLVRSEVPRATVGAAIAGIEAVCMTTSLDAFRIAPNQMPMAVVHVLLGVATVYVWTYAAPRLANTSAVACAGGFLLLEGISNLGVARWLEIAAPRGFSWHEVWLAIAVQAVVAGGSACLWFWLLQRMEIAAFCMNALATWTATILPGVVVLGFLQWQVDVAAVVAVGAVVVGVRAGVADEQPTALGLGGT